MASAAKVTIAEVENLVEPGENRPGLYPHPGHICQTGRAGRENPISSRNRLGVYRKMEKVKLEGLPREMIALRISKEIKDGDYVNLGIGIPTLISNWKKAGISCSKRRLVCSNQDH